MAGMSRFTNSPLVYHVGFPALVLALTVLGTWWRTRSLKTAAVATGVIAAMMLPLLALGILGTGEQLEAERDVPSSVGEGHHRDAVPGERAVGVVPFRALGVHPETATGHEVGNLGQQRNQQLLRQIGATHRP